LSGRQFASNGEGARQMEEKKEKKLRRRRRRRSLRHHSVRAESNGLDLPGFSSRIDLLSIEAKLDPTGVACLNDNFFSAADNTLATLRQEFRRDSLAVSGNRDPGLFAGVDDDRELARSRGGSGGHAGSSFGGADGGRSNSLRTVFCQATRCRSRSRGTIVACQPGGCVAR